MVHCGHCHRVVYSGSGQLWGTRPHRGISGQDSSRPSHQHAGFQVTTATAGLVGRARCFMFMYYMCIFSSTLSLSSAEVSLPWVDAECLFAVGRCWVCLLVRPSNSVTWCSCLNEKPLIMPQDTTSIHSLLDVLCIATSVLCCGNWNKNIDLYFMLCV